MYQAQFLASMPTILLARHGQASFGGGDYDVLSSAGVAQSAALARELVSRKLTVDRVVSGSLRRQLDTAGPSAAALGCAVAVDPRWNEYDIDNILAAHSRTPARPSRPADAAGRAVSSREFQELLDQALLEWIRAGDESPATESWPAFAARVSAGLTNAVEELGPGSTGLVFTSGGVLAAVCVDLLALPESSLLNFNRVTVNTGVTKVIHGRRGSTLVSFNEHAHLERTTPSLVTYR